MRLVRFTVRPEDITSEHDVPWAVGLAVTAAWTVLAGVLTAVLYVLGHPWLWWYRFDQLPVIGGVSAFTSVLLAPAIVRRWPEAFTAPDEPRPPAGPPCTPERSGRSWSAGRRCWASGSPPGTPVPAAPSGPSYRAGRCPPRSPR